ncbi:Alpha/Beta hydrolase protein [Massariosphaeria phaeospora]|uniref:Alpha/Beta hydrolase protein n=1 Tax=Massariosphaeria phaeospora TaxID=100035 RepID=A0A7C8MMD8_9PLEO|nr:Alpha/Beta hydrolase protein [Massariosphaeria phaeospora]
MGLYNTIVVPLAFVSGIWIPATLLCCIPWVQKQMLYLHWLTLWPGKWLEEPERAGFLKNQVTPFRVPTKDEEKLFAWLIAPLGLYARHADEFINEKTDVQGVEDRVAFRLLKDDPEARLLVYFHGNTATLAQARRTEEYRMYAAGASDKIFVLTFDYRGFGKSSGTPSEPGVLNDAEAVVSWALHVARIPADRIVLLGHSLGTAVASAIAHRYANTDVPTDFAGLILCAAFTNAGSAFASYSIGHVLPILAPIKMIPALQAWFTRRMRDTWETDRRLAALAREGSKYRIVLVHAEDDQTMPWDQTEELFRSTLQAATDGDESPNVQTIDLGEAGRQQIWDAGIRSISKLIAKHGARSFVALRNTACEARGLYNLYRTGFLTAIGNDTAQNAVGRSTVITCQGQSHDQIGREQDGLHLMRGFVHANYAGAT